MTLTLAITYITTYHNPQILSYMIPIHLYSHRMNFGEKIVQNSYTQLDDSNDVGYEFENLAFGDVVKVTM